MPSFFCLLICLTVPVICFDRQVFRESSLSRTLGFSYFDLSPSRPLVAPVISFVGLSIFLEVVSHFFGGFSLSLLVGLAFLWPA